MKTNNATTEYHTEWHWGPLHFDGLLGLHGTYLCFHRHPDPSHPDAIVDPAKPVLPLGEEARSEAIGRSP